VNWDDILKYEGIIRRIAIKYSGEPSLAEDVAQEVMLKLYEDKKLDINKFDPAKKDAAIRNTIRNKVIKVLRSRKSGRWTFQSLDALQDVGYQIDDSSKIFYAPERNDELESDYFEWHHGDNNVNTPDPDLDSK
jgi:DNA-directed RNA polymerase specialized sigma24 family protein